MFRSLREYFRFFDERLNGVWAVIVLLWLISASASSSARSLAREWRLLVPVVYGFALYAQVWVDWRYLGAFVTLLLIALLCALRIPEFERKQQITGAAAITIMVVLGSHICTYSYDKVRQPDAMLEHLEVAHSLSAMNVLPGGEIASIGDANIAFWARLARVRIVAEIPYDVWDPALRVPDVTDVDIFWGASADEKAAVMREFAKTGAKAVVARDVPPGTAGLGWQRVPKTTYSIYRLY
jgi:hypothetical protein